MAHNKTILIIEDESAIADNIAIALKAEGYLPLHETLAHKGIEVLQTQSVDLVILDVGLPDTSGFEACKAIRQFSNVPIIFLTARSSEIDRVVGLEIGADDYVTKPFSPRELVTRVKLRLRTFDAPAAVQSQSDSPFSLDETSKTIQYHGKRLDLTAFEFGILRALINHPNRVYSREQLMASVRDMPEVSQARSVDNHIKSLRAKLSAITPEEQPIKTHRSMGYSLSL